jgi:ComF family protein
MFQIIVSGLHLIEKSNNHFIFSVSVFIITDVKKLIQATGSLLKNVQQLFWQNYCRLCNQVISEDDKHFCSECWSQIGFCIVDSFCLRCGREISPFGRLPDGCAKCQEENFHFDSIACAGIYKPPLSSLIVRFKLADRTHLLPVLADFAQNAIYKVEFFHSVDFIVPVPLHWRRRFDRGFNQSALIAKKLRLSDAKFNTDLVKIRHTDDQTAVTFAARKRNLQGAFAVRKGHNFKGKNVCLIDDIKTTGATLNECAKVLKEAGADKVFAFVLAVAGQKDKEI